MLLLLMRQAAAVQNQLGTASYQPGAMLGLRPPRPLLLLLLPLLLLLLPVAAGGFPAQ
jgi:hypothetical protein